MIEGKKCPIRHATKKLKANQPKRETMRKHKTSEFPQFWLVLMKSYQSYWTKTIDSYHPPSNITWMSGRCGGRFGGHFGKASGAMLAGMCWMTTTLLQTSTYLWLIALYSPLKGPLGCCPQTLILVSSILVRCIVVCFVITRQHQGVKRPYQDTTFLLSLRSSLYLPGA